MYYVLVYKSGRKHPRNVVLPSSVRASLPQETHQVVSSCTKNSEVADSSHDCKKNSKYKSNLD